MAKNNKYLAYIFVLLFLASPISVFAHPGNTAADGCHYCRTNCDKWGVPWNERHCHGGGIETVETSTIPTTPPTRIPTRIPTKTPTSTPIITQTPTKSEPTPTVSVPTNTPVPTNTSTQSQVLGSTTSTTNNSSSNPLGGIAIFAWVVYGIVKLGKRFKKTKENSS